MIVNDMASESLAAFSVTVADLGHGLVVVTATGDIDVSTAREFRQALDEASALTERTVVVDLADVGFVDSTGFGQLVGAAAAGPREFVIANCRPIVRNAARVLGLHSVVTVHAYGEPGAWPGVRSTAPSGLREPDAG